MFSDWLHKKKNGKAKGETDKENRAKFRIFMDLETVSDIAKGAGLTVLQLYN
jgi:hypothetical protein